MTDEYMTLSEAALAVGIKRSSLYYYIDKLHIKTQRYDLNKHTYIAVEDVERIKAVREKPWTVEAGDDTLKMKAIKPAA